VNSTVSTGDDGSSDVERSSANYVGSGSRSWRLINSRGKETIMSKTTRAELLEEVAALKATNVALLSFADGAAAMARTIR
jgi:hypothetical protein